MVLPKIREDLSPRDDMVHQIIEEEFARHKVQEADEVSGESHKKAVEAVLNRVESLNELAVVLWKFEHERDE